MPYDIVVLGAPQSDVLNDLKQALNNSFDNFPVNDDCLVWHEGGEKLQYSPKRQICVVFFGAQNTQVFELPEALKPLISMVPVIPVVTDIRQVHEQIPEYWQALNCIPINTNGLDLLATTILASLGLLPEQRRVFISYRRCESTPVALQLFDQLSAHRFNVFLDTHEILPAKEFQSELMHSLSDSDVLLMLDTPEYFESEWTSVEFGKAQTKNITILRLGWPRVRRSEKTATVVDNMDLSAHCFTKSKKLRKRILSQVVKMIENGRSKGMALRQKINLGKVCGQIKLAGGAYKGVGQGLAINAQLAGGSEILLRPIIGVPSAYDLQKADEQNHHPKQVAMLYDSLDLKGDCLAHIDWLAKNVQHIPWLTMQDLDKQLLKLEQKL